jgi:hypothetical protein
MRRCQYLATPRRSNASSLLTKCSPSQPDGRTAERSGAPYCDTRDVEPMKAAMLPLSFARSGTCRYIMCPAS